MAIIPTVIEVNNDSERHYDIFSLLLKLIIVLPSSHTKYSFAYINLPSTNFPYINIQPPLFKIKRNRFYSIPLVHI